MVGDRFGGCVTHNPHFGRLDLIKSCRLHGLCFITPASYQISHFVLYDLARTKETWASEADG